MSSIIEVSAGDYAKRFGEGRHVFNSQKFIALNAHKTSRLRHLVVADGNGKARFGLTAGLTAGESVLLSPFSAPFGGLDFTRTERADVTIDAVEALCRYPLPIRLTLPPGYLDPQMNSQIAAALMCSARRLWSEWNYHYPLCQASEFERHLSGAARRNLHTALGYGLDFEALPCTEEAITRAYRIIEANHQSRGYRLRMSLQDVISTAKVVKSDFFVMSLDGRDCAAAQIYHTAPGVVQLINWGDLDWVRPMRAMNLMMLRICRHYSEMGVRIFDLGPASEQGVPSLGLCEFKQSLGCVLTLKHTFLTHK